MNDLGSLDRLPSDLIALFPYPVQIKILAGSKKLRQKFLAGLLNHEVAQWKDLQRILPPYGFVEVSFNRFTRDFWQLADTNYLFKQYVIMHMIFQHILQRDFTPLPSHPYCDLKYMQQVALNLKNGSKSPQQILNDTLLENPLLACVIAHIYKLDISRLVIITLETKSFHIFQLIMSQFPLDREIIKPTLLEWKKMGHTKSIAYALSLIAPYNKCFLEYELR